MEPFICYHRSKKRDKAPSKPKIKGVLIMKVALIQMNATESVPDNQAKALQMCEAAISAGAQFLCLPEVFQFRKQRVISPIQTEAIPGPSTQPLMALAKQHQVWILAGSISEQIPGSKKCFNTSILINERGEISAQYRKIHLFDVTLETRSIKESGWFEAGDTPVLGQVNGLTLGMSVCYDLRFSDLYRYYADKGAQIITVPASFTSQTGAAHWSVLLRARAIETQCFVLAPNQIGVGVGDIPIYGHSMVIDPWGKVLAEGSADQEELVMAELDIDYQAKVRQSLPSLTHRKKIPESK